MYTSYCSIKKYLYTTIFIIQLSVTVFFWEYIANIFSIKKQIFETEAAYIVVMYRYQNFGRYRVPISKFGKHRYEYWQILKKPILWQIPTPGGQNPDFILTFFKSCFVLTQEVEILTYPDFILTVWTLIEKKIITSLN